MDFTTWFRNTYDKSHKAFTVIDLRHAYEAGQNPKRANFLSSIEQMEENFKRKAKEKAARRYDG